MCYCCLHYIHNIHYYLTMHTFTGYCPAHIYNNLMHIGFVFRKWICPKEQKENITRPSSWSDLTSRQQKMLFYPRNMWKRKSIIHATMTWALTKNKLWFSKIQGILAQCTRLSKNYFKTTLCESYYKSTLCESFDSLSVDFIEWWFALV